MVESEDLLRAYVNQRLTDDRMFNMEDEAIITVNGEDFTPSDVDEAITEVLD